MTKLEEKLIELGYEYQLDLECYKKQLSRFIHIFIEVVENKINDFGIYYNATYIRKQYQLDNIQQAYNEMQKDLEVLRQCYE